jgi:hypothetical protein
MQDETKILSRRFGSHGQQLLLTVGWNLDILGLPQTTTRIGIPAVTKFRP